MSARFSINTEKVTEAILSDHIVAYTVVTEVLRQQSQAIIVSDGNKGGLVFDLHVNLNRQQCERLILKTIKTNLLGYAANVDWDKKKLLVTRVNKTSGKKPVKASKPASSRGDSGGDPI